MRQILALLVLTALPLPSLAQDAVAPVATAAPVVITTQTLDEFLWTNRLVLVFADTPRDPAFVRQMDMLRVRAEGLVERDVLVLTDTDPAARSAIRTKLRPRGFAVVIVDKDGRVLQRKPAPWDVREISAAIDKTPLRQQELKEAREAERQGVSE